MCLGVPGRVVRWLDRDELTAAAEIDFGGVRKSCHMACVPDAREGDYVLVHAGVALAVLDDAPDDGTPPGKKETDDRPFHNPTDSAPA